MERALTAVCDYLNNYFEVDGAGETGHFVVENHTIACPFLADGQYFRIVGSVFDDGVHKYPVYDLQNEAFDGVIYPLAIPDSFLELVTQIEEYMNNPQNAPSPYTSESFAGYSYTKASGGNSNSNVAADWHDVFRKRLNRWRKVW